MKLCRTWTVYALGRRDQDYDRGIIPLLRVSTAKEFWEAWQGIERVLRLLLDKTARLTAGGAELYGFALFGGESLPSWESPEHKGGASAQAMLDSVDSAMECTLFAIGDAVEGCSVSGIRILRGRRDGCCRAELWTQKKTVKTLQVQLDAHLAARQ